MARLILSFRKKPLKDFTGQNISFKWNASLLACSTDGHKILSRQQIFNLNWANMRHLLFKL